MSPASSTSAEHVTRVSAARWGQSEFFGGLAVAAVVVHRQSERALGALGLSGWREASPRALEALAGKVERIVPSERLLIDAARYNKAVKAKGGVSALIRWAMERVCGGLLERYPECRAAVCEPLPYDGEAFTPGRNVFVVMPGEGYVDCALEAAGAVARWLYLDRRAEMERKLGLCLQGDEASVGSQILREHGAPVLSQVAKLDGELGVSLLARVGA